jgi:D-xylose transport system permease protein
LPASLTGFATGFLPPAPAITLVLAVFALFAVFQSATARHARQLQVIERIGPTVLRALLPPAAFTAAAVWLASWQGIPYLVLLVAGSAIAAEILMRRTRFGVQLYAIGGNPEAARLSGIDVNRAIFVNFMIAGLAYGITGIALMPSPPRSSEAPRSTAARGACLALWSGRCSWEASITA